MSWLELKRQEFEEEAARKKAKDEKAQREWEARDNRCKERAKHFADNHLADLVGRETKDGKILSLVYEKNSYHTAVMYAGEEKFLEIWFYYEAISECDSDGCSWPTDEYRVVSNMSLYRPHVKKDGYSKHPGGGREHLNEDNLAHYLLEFLK